MGNKVSDLLPTAKDLHRQGFARHPKNADDHARRLAATETKKRALIDELSKPSGLSEDEKVKLASTVIRHAAHNGLTECQIYRFPHSLCTDHGRAITRQDDGWENTLTGKAKEIHQLWVDHLQPRGYLIRYQAIDFPGGVPGDISIILNWDV